MEMGATGSKIHNLYWLISNAGQQNASSNEVIKESDGSLIRSDVGLLEFCWNTKQFSWPNNMMDLLFVHKSEPMQVDISSPSEMEVISKACFVKSHKAARPDELLSSFSITAGEVLAPELM